MLPPSDLSFPISGMKGLNLMSPAKFISGLPSHTQGGPPRWGGENPPPTLSAEMRPHVALQGAQDSL